MKKIFYISLVLSLFSCTSNDDSTQDEDTPSPIVQTEKAYAYCTDGVGTGPSSKEYYEFTYENGSLTNVKGRFYPVFMQMFNMFFTDRITKLAYSGNTVTVSELEPGAASGYHEYRYTMDNNRPVKQEHYYVNNVTGPNAVTETKTYTYEQNKLKNSYWKFDGPGIYEYFATYYYDNNNNLTKCEVLEKVSGVDTKFSTVTYSDFDNAANPFKKLYLINDTFFEKSLSANNFRKRESSTVTINSGLPPKTGTKKWTYKYDTNGQIILY
ncbi:hypothetical protein DBR39_03690 [Chryseobacterium sp. KBW03]|uniref:hypothetical protein n=1 Tax=Chryseobacterium sp. KBW03 TaxID=2153362 RepID=UPI000F591DFC|nr:hypothetical protein [Chryseobacterium sp. KBW03]RQO41727.1 hypothetical protein DBR39_03690 [Chryseobacterium sp. KBW03]